MNILKSKEYLRSMVFGIEDSLVSTTGLIAGIAIGSDSKQIILLAGFVAITIEAVSMGIGEYLSSDTTIGKKDNPILSGILMFVCYFIAGFVPLTPLILLDLPISLGVSVIASLVSLFLLGYVKGKIVQTNPIKMGLKIFLLGGLATILGLVVGLVFKL